MVQDRAIVTTADQFTNLKSYTICRLFNISRTARDPDFKVTPISDVEYGINGTRHMFTPTMDNYQYSSKNHSPRTAC